MDGFFSFFVMYIKDRVSFFFLPEIWKNCWAWQIFFFFFLLALARFQKGGKKKKILYVLCSVKRRLASAVNLTRKEMSGPENNWRFDPLINGTTGEIDKRFTQSYPSLGVQWFAVARGGGTEKIWSSLRLWRGWCGSSCQSYKLFRI